MSRLISIGLLLVALAAAALMLGCSTQAQVEAETNRNPEPPPVNVSVSKLKPATLRDEVQLAGRLEPWVEVQVSTELGGTVQEIGFDKGRAVRKGQVLARIGTDLLEAALAEVEAELQHAESEFNKTTELFSRQAVPRQNLTSATSNYRRAEARVKQAKLRCSGRSFVLPSSVSRSGARLKWVKSCPRARS